MIEDMTKIMKKIANDCHLSSFVIYTRISVHEPICTSTLQSISSLSVLEMSSLSTERWGDFARVKQLKRTRGQASQSYALLCVPRLACLKLMLFTCQVG